MPSVLVTSESASVPDFALVMIVTQQKGTPVPNLENRVLDWMGNVSYEIYVTQIIVIVLLSSVYGKVGMELPAVVIYLVCTAVVIGVASCFHGLLKKRQR